MIAEMKLGRYRQRNGGTAAVKERTDASGWPWIGRRSDGLPTTWTDDGHHLASTRPDELDLVEYLGPSEQTGETQ